jgi:hypothetical protein
MRCAQLARLVERVVPRICLRQIRHRIGVVRHARDVHHAAIEDGADPEVLETRVTHTRKSRSAFDGYNRRLHWERTCAELSKLRIARGPRGSAAEQPIAASGDRADPWLASDRDADKHLHLFHAQVTR